MTRTEKFRGLPVGDELVAGDRDDVDGILAAGIDSGTGSAGTPVVGSAGIEGAEDVGRGLLTPGCGTLTTGTVVVGGEEGLAGPVVGALDGIGPDGVEVGAVEDGNAPVTGVAVAGSTGAEDAAGRELTAALGGSVFAPAAVSRAVSALTLKPASNNPTTPRCRISPPYRFTFLLPTPRG